METSDLLQLRPYLFRIAYNMVADVQEAEDLVQDAFEKWLRTGGKDVQNAKAYLARVVVNASIDRLERLKRERETYKGPWLPEPYVTLEPESAGPTIDYGLLFLLERLNPVERAVFILRESFSEEYEAIAALTGQSEENCRQILHRAKEKLRRKPGSPVDPAVQRNLVEAFTRALGQQDRSALEKLLRQDIELYSDGGGKRAAALRPLFGFEKVFKFLDGVATLNRGVAFTFRPVFVNGQPAALLYNLTAGEIDSVITISYDETGITTLFAVRNPDKLTVR